VNRALLARELIRKIRYIQIKTNHLVDEVFAGQYASAFKGSGIEFEEVREYQPGDDIRSIDWNVTARMGKPFVKQYVEERELTVILAVDISPSTRFGTRNQFKVDLAAELAAVLAFSATRNNDKVGLVTFTDIIEGFFPPAKGSRHALRLIREVLSAKPQGRGTDISKPLQYINRVTRNRAVVFLISDFLSSGFEREALITTRRHKLVPVRITDPFELQIPAVGIITLRDAETGEAILLDTRDVNTRKRFAAIMASRRKDIESLFRKTGVEVMDIDTGAPYIDRIKEYFARQEQHRYV